MKTKLPLLVLAVLLLLAPGTGAQEGGDSAQPADDGESGLFFESVDVNLVNVDVWVTDKKGNPITGLKAEDFEILEEKRPVKITNFFAVESGAAVTPVAIEPPPAEGREVPDELPAPPPPPLPDEQQLSVVVYVDNFNIRPFNRNRTFRRLREFLYENVRKQDRVMLVSYDRTLNIRHPFTTDSALIANALFDLEKLSGHAVHFDSERREIIRDMNEAEGIGEVEWRVRQFAQSQFNDLAFTLDALKEIVTSLAGLPGRKALLYVSDGLPMTPAEDLFQALQHRFHDSSAISQMHDFNAARKFKQIAADANSNRVSFYTIDAAGLRVQSSASAEVASASIMPGLDSLMDSVHISNYQSTIRFMAEQTGGMAIINTNDIGPGLERIATDFGTYYSLGYIPSHSGDGRYYNIEVRLKEKRKGVKVRHREGYRDKSIYNRMSDTTRSTLLYGFASNPLSVDFRVGGSSPAKGGHFKVPILVDIPIGNIELIPRQDFHEGRVKIFLSAMDDDGGMADVQEIPVPIRIPAAQVEHARTQPYRYMFEMMMRGGGHRLAVGVRDEIGANISFVTKTVLIGS